TVRPYPSGIASRAAVVSPSPPCRQLKLPHRRVDRWARCDRSDRVARRDDALDSEGGAEAFFPPMGQEFGDLIPRLRLDPDEHIGEVDLWVDVMSLAGGHERVERHEAMSSAVVAEEQRILSCERNDS